jgi:HNH endonuclease
LTVDHFQPSSHGGSDSLDNLLYCCYRCNLYKADYWPAQPGDPVLWNPRRESMDTHRRPLADGTLYSLTATGGFTLKRLRLNRPQLVALRLGRQAEAEKKRLVARYQDLLTMLEQLHHQQARMLEEQRALLEEQRALLKLFLQG